MLLSVSWWICIQFDLVQKRNQAFVFFANTHVTVKWRSGRLSDDHLGDRIRKLLNHSRDTLVERFQKDIQLLFLLAVEYLKDRFNLRIVVIASYSAHATWR